MAPLGLLSTREYVALLHKAPKQRLDVNSLLFSSREDEPTRYEVGVVIVLQGRLDIHMWTDSEPSRETPTLKTDPRFPLLSREKPLRVTDQALAIASIGRGQSFGDQAVALGHCNLWSSTTEAEPLPSRAGATFRVLVGEPGTEVLWISRTLYEHHLRDDRLRCAYIPCALLESSSTTKSHTQQWEDMATLSSSAALKRDTRQVSQLGRRVTTDAGLSSFFSQFPPLVIERLCSSLSVLHIPPGDKTRLVELGDSIQYVMVVIRGSLELHRPDNTAATTAGASTTPRSLKSRGTTDSPPLDAAIDWYQSDQLVPGDSFGAVELSRKRSTSLYAVDATADSLLLCIPHLVFSRWMASSTSELIFTPGSTLAKITAASSPSKVSGSDYRRLSMTVARRMSSKPPSPSKHPLIQAIPALPQLSEAVGSLLERLGVLSLLPTFLVSQLLPYAVLVHKRAGEVLFQETDEKQVLVTVMTGFASIYSREHTASAVEMLQSHPFCCFSAFHGSHRDPDEYAETMSLDNDESIVSCSTSQAQGSRQQSPPKLPHRFATHGLHIQTLPPLSAFRTGVLQEGRVCPGTVVAQTDCDFLLFDEGVYSHILETHSPAIDLCSLSMSVTPPTGISSEGEAGESRLNSSATITKCLESSLAPWLRLSGPKRQLVIRSMRQVVLVPGQQFVAVSDSINELVVVVAGALTLFVRQADELSPVLEARQHSLKSITLERSVTSNYSTTSQQLYSDDHNSSGCASTMATRPRGIKSGDSFAIRRQLSRITRESQPKTIGVFVDSVLAAVEEEKFRRESVKPNTSSESGQQVVTPLLHSAIHRAKIDRKLSAQRDGRRLSRYSGQYQGKHRALLLCRLGPGDTLGEEALTPPGGCRRSQHDVFAEAASPSSTGEQGRVELLCLDRRVYQLIVSKTDEEAESELRMRTAAVRSKWKRAGRDAASNKRLEASTGVLSEREHGRPAQAATPKLLSLFQSLVNQRYHLTSRALAAIPLLRDLSDAAKREICLVAKFETLDRRSDTSSLFSGSSSKPFFILLSGRVALVGRNNFSQGSVAVPGGSTATDSSQWLREVAIGDGFGEFDIFVPGPAPCVVPEAIEPAKMLSIPAPMFLKHWPKANEMKENIDYLRSVVSVFSDLAIDRLAGLNQIVEFQNFTRGETVFDLTRGTSRASVVGKMCLIKSGTCCVRRLLSLPSHHTANDSLVSSWTTVDSPARIMTVKATIADVSAGHFFWIQDDTHPFTLEVVSAHATVAFFPIDRLRAVLPRVNLSNLDAQRQEMDTLHQSQVRLAHQAMKALVKEKQAAASAVVKLSARGKEIQVVASPTSEPAPTTRTLPLVTPRHSVEVSDRREPLSPQSSPPGDIPVAPQTESVALSTTHTLPPFFGSTMRRPCHQREHYSPESEMVALAGSFSTDEQVVSSSSSPHVLNPTKQDETSRAESTTSSTSRPASREGFKRSDKSDRGFKALQLSFNVSIPRIPVDSPALAVSGLAASCRPRTPRVSTPNQQPETRTTSWRLSEDSSIADNSVRLEVVHPLHRRGPCQDDSDQDGGNWTVGEVDLRARVAARLSDVGSPLRTISLAPYKPGERSGDDANALTTALESPLCLDGQRELSAPHPSLKGGAHRRVASSPQQTRGPGKCCQPELVRKQGFLTVSSPTCDSMVASRGGRRFFMLVGNQLREFPDSVARHDLPNERWVNCYRLQPTTKVVGATDREVSMSGRVRTQRFQVAFDATTTMNFTAPSVMERKQWMAALSDACSFVSDSGASPYPRIKQVQPLAKPDDVPLSSRSRKRTTAPASSNNAVEGDAMPVEYCIS